MEPLEEGTDRTALTRPPLPGIPRGDRSPFDLDLDDAAKTPAPDPNPVRGSIDGVRPIR